MKTIRDRKKLWKCPTCGREFERQGQTHSCKPFPIEQHFEGKPQGKILYTKLKQAIKSKIGTFKTESLECCIHLVSSYTFAAVKIFQAKIQLEFSLSHKIKSPRIKKSLQLSARRYLYYIDVLEPDDIDRELVDWLHEAHDMKNAKAALINSSFNLYTFKQKP
jgi:hypothetical protein